MDGQACLHRHVDIRRVPDSEQLCCELPGTANGLAVSCAYRVSIAIMQPQVAEKHPTIGGNQRILQIKYCLEKNVAR